MQAQLWEQSRRQAKSSSLVAEHSPASCAELQPAGAEVNAEAGASAALTSAARAAPGSPLLTASSLGMDGQSWMHIEQQLSSLEHALNASASQKAAAVAVAVMEDSTSAGSQVVADTAESIHISQQDPSDIPQWAAGLPASHGHAEDMRPALLTPQDSASTSASASAELSAQSEQVLLAAPSDHVQLDQEGLSSAVSMPAGSRTLQAFAASSHQDAGQMEQEPVSMQQKLPHEAAQPHAGEWSDRYFSDLRVPSLFCGPAFEQIWLGSMSLCTKQ